MLKVIKRGISVLAAFALLCGMLAGIAPVTASAEGALIFHDEFDTYTDANAKRGEANAVRGVTADSGGATVVADDRAALGGYWKRSNVSETGTGWINTDIGAYGIQTFIEGDDTLEIAGHSTWEQSMVNLYSDRAVDYSLTKFEVRYARYNDARAIQRFNVSADEKSFYEVGLSGLRANEETIAGSGKTGYAYIRKVVNGHGTELVAADTQTHGGTSWFISEVDIDKDAKTISYTLKNGNDNTVLYSGVYTEQGEFLERGIGNMVFQIGGAWLRPRNENNRVSVDYVDIYGTPNREVNIFYDDFSAYNANNAKTTAGTAVRGTTADSGGATVVGDARPNVNGYWKRSNVFKGYVAGGYDGVRAFINGSLNISGQSDIEYGLINLHSPGAAAYDVTKIAVVFAKYNGVQTVMRFNVSSDEQSFYEAGIHESGGARPYLRKVVNGIQTAYAAATSATAGGTSWMNAVITIDAASGGITFRGSKEQEYDAGNNAWSVTLTDDGAFLNRGTDDVIFQAGSKSANENDFNQFAAVSVSGVAGRLHWEVDGGTVTVSIPAAYASKVTEYITVLAASYSGNRLIGFDFEKVPAESIAAPVTLNLSEEVGSAHRLFLWAEDGFALLSPLCPTINLD
ncbi:MAG: hypothetical protein LBH54_01845 [Clostridiales bacterium]|jgi:hypothetical protein|nr:hypothetical protein [Clostridiales bacterium]